MSVVLGDVHSDVMPDTEESCAAYLFGLKWPNGFVCPECSHRHAYTIVTRRLPLYECANCRHQTSLTAGTVMENTRTPLSKWFLAIRLVSDRQRGISAIMLMDKLSVTYKTAWAMLHKIRKAIASEEQDRSLAGDVIIHDASYGRPVGVASAEFHPEESVLLVGASISEEKEVTRVSFRVLDSRKHIKQGVLLPAAVEDFQYEHNIDSQRVVSCLTQRYSPRKHKRLIPIVKEARLWLTETFGGIGKKYLQLYLHEFCCRVNLQLGEKSVFDGISRICAAYRILN